MKKSFLMKFATLAFAGAVALLGANVAAAGSFIITVEAPGVQNTTATFVNNNSGVQNFDSLGTGLHDGALTVNFGSDISGTYNNISIVERQFYGGAGTDGNFAAAGFNVPNDWSTYEDQLQDDGIYSLTNIVNNADGNNSGVNYFGLWISALDAANTITFCKDGDVIESFNTRDILSYVQTDPLYLINPNNGEFTGPNDNEYFVFVNFYGDVAFDEIQFKEDLTGKWLLSIFESDNHTLGVWREMGGDPIYPPAVVPEPASLVLFGTGLGILGLATWRKRMNK